MAHKFIYPSGEADQVIYNPPKSADHEPEIGLLEEGQTVNRSFDGTVQSYSDFDKKYFELTFSHASKTQFDYFMQLYRFHCPIDLYIDGVNLDATAIMMNAPAGGPEAAFDNSGNKTYSFSVRFEEV